MSTLKDTFDFKEGDIVYAKSDYFDEISKKFVRIKNKGYSVCENSEKSSTVLFVMFADGVVWSSRKINYRRHKYQLTDFL